MQVILFCSPISSVLFDHLEELLSSANCFNTAKNYLLTLISNGISVSDTSVRSGIDLSFNFATNLSFSASGISSADFETIQIALLVASTTNIFAKAPDKGALVLYGHFPL